MARSHGGAPAAVRRLRVCALALCAAVLAACGSSPTLPPQPERAPVVSDRDGTPAFRGDMDSIPDAIPRADPVTNAGNKSPYTVLGQTYRVVPRPAGYRERGLGSWYGTKFHGRNTSNGEPYDVYAMTAAHKTLPIPSYLRVTNLENGRRTIVRVNDRGPFHEGRILDLSYAAAYKLGYANSGTALIETEVLDPNAPEWVAARRRAERGEQIADAASIGAPARSTPVAASVPASAARVAPAMAPARAPARQTVVAQTGATGSGRTWVQAGAFRSMEGAERLRDRLAGLFMPEAVEIHAGEVDGTPWYRVRVGPLSPQSTSGVLDALASANLGGGRVVSD